MPSSGGELSLSDLETVRNLVSQRYGFWVKDEWFGQLRSKVVQRMRTIGEPGFAAYRRRLELHDGETTELQELVEELLNHESQFNRNPEQLALLKSEVLLGWRETMAPWPKRIVSLGCSTGEEAYSLAILAEQVLGERADDVLILGMDVSRRALAAARQAQYSEFRLRDVPSGDRARCFTKEGELWAVHPRLRKRVRFLQQNLVEPLPTSSLDVIFCCNVLIYFPVEAAQRLLRQFYSALKPYGHLFLGHADSFVLPPELFRPIEDGSSRCFVRQPASALNLNSFPDDLSSAHRHEPACQ